LQELTKTEKTHGTEGGAPFCYINEANIKEDNKGTKCDIMKGLVSSAQGNVIIKLTANELGADTSPVPVEAHIPPTTVS
jgi:hypothetical protein